MAYCLLLPHHHCFVENIRYTSRTCVPSIPHVPMRIVLAILVAYPARCEEIPDDNDDDDEKEKERMAWEGGA